MTSALPAPVLDPVELVIDVTADADIGMPARTAATVQLPRADGYARSATPIGRSTTATSAIAGAGAPRGVGADGAAVRNAGKAS